MLLVDRRVLPWGSGDRGLQDCPAERRGRHTACGWKACAMSESLGACSEKDFQSESMSKRYHLERGIAWISMPSSDMIRTCGAHRHRGPVHTGRGTGEAAGTHGAGHGWSGRENPVRQTRVCNAHDEGEGPWGRGSLLIKVREERA